MTKDFLALAADLARSEHQRIVHGMTHRTVDTPPNGRFYLTLCGWEVRRTEIDEHAPTCPKCAALLAAELEDTRTAEDVFGAQAPPPPTRAPIPDVRAEYEQRHDNSTDAVAKRTATEGARGTSCTSSNRLRRSPWSIRS